LAVDGCSSETYSHPIDMISQSTEASSLEFGTDIANMVTDTYSLD